MKPKTLEMETNLTVGEDKNKCQLSTFNEDKMSSQDAGNHNDNALVMDVEERTPLLHQPDARNDNDMASSEKPQNSAESK